MRARCLWVFAAILALGACGGGEDPLAQLCVDEAAKRLEGQVYRLDEGEIAKSKETGADGNVNFKGSVILKPGTGGESTQTLECTVAPAAGDAPARVIGFQFNVQGSGVTG